jgi:hypothetical protein
LYIIVASWYVHTVWRWISMPIGFVLGFEFVDG